MAFLRVVFSTLKLMLRKAFFLFYRVPERHEKARYKSGPNYYSIS